MKGIVETIGGSLVVMLAIWLAFAFGWTLREASIYRGMFNNTVVVNPINIPQAGKKVITK